MTKKKKIATCRVSQNQDTISSEEETRAKLKTESANSKKLNCEQIPITMASYSSQSLAEPSMAGAAQQNEVYHLPQTATIFLCQNLPWQELLNKMKFITFHKHLPSSCVRTIF